MPRSKWDSEVELASVIVEHFRMCGWTVYPELNDIDIIAVKPDVAAPKGLKIIGIECKKSFNLTVLSQAWWKRIYVDEMYVGVSPGYDKVTSFGKKTAVENGFGVIYASKLKLGPEIDYSVKFEAMAAVHYRTQFCVDKLLDPRAESYAEAGRKGGKQWTRFKRTVMDILEYAKSNPGCSLSDAIKNVPHHYSHYDSARSAISKMCRDEIIEEFDIVNGIIVPS